jgi:hypothetical protein
VSGLHPIILYHQRKSPRYGLDRGPVGPQSRRCRCGGERKLSCPYWESNIQSSLLLIHLIISPVCLYIATHIVSLCLYVCVLMHICVSFYFPREHFIPQEMFTGVIIFGIDIMSWTSRSTRFSPGVVVTFFANIIRYTRTS